MGGTVTTVRGVAEPAALRLMNTVQGGRDGLYDTLESRDDLVGWIAEVIPGAGITVTGDDLAAYRRVRDALRAVGTAVADRPAGPGLTGHVREINNWARRAQPPQLRLRGHRLDRAEPAGRRVQAALATLAAEAVELFTEGNVLACGAPGCVLFFVPGHPRQEWCSTTCGNRVRAARHYRRHRTGSG
jgi:hypothetical protein